GDSATAYATLGRLVSSPGQAVPYLGKQLQAAESPDRKRIEQLVRELGDDRFQIRERAVKELAALGNAAVPALEDALLDSPSLELKRRLTTLLERFEGATLSGESLRWVRAVESLEYSATPEARELLESVAANAPQMRLVHEAKAALGRLSK